MNHTRARFFGLQSLNVKYEIPFMVESILINIKNSSSSLVTREILVFWKFQSSHRSKCRKRKCWIKISPKISFIFPRFHSEYLRVLWNVTNMRGWWWGWEWGTSTKRTECWVKFEFWYQIFKISLLIARVTT